MSQTPAYAQGVPIIGMSWPWTSAGPSAAWEVELINAKIDLVVFTFIGAHKMEPSFGSNILGLVFENRGETLSIAADVEIRRVLAEWIPDLRVLSVEVTDARESGDPEGTVTITVNYEWLGRTGTWTGDINPATALAGGS